jgi:ferredoxin-NADP reductase
VRRAAVQQFARRQLGGSGLAPILAMVGRALATGHADPIELILSVRDRSEAFAPDPLHALVPAPCQLHLAHHLDPRAPGSGGLAAWPRPRLAGSERPDLAHWRVLAAARVSRCLAALAGTLGAKGDRILTDSFTPTPG